MSVARALVVFFALAHSAAAAHADPVADTPLLTYAMQQQFAALPDNENSRAALARAEHALRVNETPRGNCARTIGAQRFSMLWHELGIARANRADHRGAIIALRRATECLPRDIGLLSSLATELKWAGDFAAARSVLNRALSIDAQNASVRQQMGQLDFIEQRWVDAVGHYRYATTRQEAQHDSRYAELMFHLAQRRAGVARPEVPTRLKKPITEDSDDSEESEWPVPVLAALRGTRSEADLLTQVLDESSYPSPQERLCEALYYLGQEWLARGQRETARRYFAAVVNTRVLYFIEYNLALIELRRMGAPPATTGTQPSAVP